MKLKDRVYIITGATSGMGKATAWLLAREGAKIVFSGRDKVIGEALQKELSCISAGHVFVAGDVKNKEHNHELVQAAISKFGQLDGVVCHAGMLGLGALTELDEQTWDDTFKTNVDAVFYLLQAALPVLIKSAVAAVVINASIAAFKSFPNHPAYCASKAAVVALAKQVAVDYAPRVRINAICPGPVDTPFIHASAAAFPDPALAVELAGRNTLVQRLGTSEDVANLVLFLISTEASWITGAAYVIDGGVTTK